MHPPLQKKNNQKKPNWKGMSELYCDSSPWNQKFKTKIRNKGKGFPVFVKCQWRFFPL